MINADRILKVALKLIPGSTEETLRPKVEGLAKSHPELSDDQAFQALVMAKQNKAKKQPDLKTYLNGGK